MQQECNSADVEVSRRLRLRRRQMRLSQGDVARALAISYQQVQKHKAGRDRLPSSRLLAFSHLLQIEPAVLFDAQDTEHPSATETIVPAIESDPDWVRLRDTFQRIGNLSLQRRIVALVRAIATKVSSMRQGHSDRGRREVKRPVPGRRPMSCWRFRRPGGRVTRVSATLGKARPRSRLGRPTRHLLASTLSGLLPSVIKPRPSSCRV